MAIACLRLFTLAPVRPLWSSPRFISCSAVPAFRWLDLLYLRAMAAGLHAQGCNLLKLSLDGVVPALCLLKSAACAVVPLLLLSACSTERAGSAVDSGGPAARAQTTIYVVRRTWHVDIGFAAKDLDVPLASLRDTFPGVQYLLFGFGDREYLIARGPQAFRVLKALWPGPGAVLVTGLRSTPQAAFGDSNVVSVKVTVGQARHMQAFVWNSLVTHAAVARPLMIGPYPGSLFYSSPQRYSLLHTCNTWVAQALASGGLPVRSAHTQLASQLWHQVQRLPRDPEPVSADLRQAAACCSPDTHP
jgi:hypothetical protein